jgi:TatD DNase family protein
LPEILKHVPLEKIVLETDSPALAPTPFRGKRNDPRFLPLIVDKIAEIYNFSHEVVAEITTTNAKNIFQLK